ncbi:rod shape-determining protein MreC [Helicobacter sp. 16-1353]|uniref:rod shape-determining protein MreC n=1 Tax=Helicobacter sp. 16-1353 TaxID=2004996 RepID=UPI000DCB3203|nr:rod shape-determining protein MreC [Helicobacter sp. 16-1353]RAX55344.1 rod shape-determining protein MreC [Helicobacter sp. 16-1353]
MKKQNKFLWLCIVFVCFLFVLEINKGIFVYITSFSNFMKENIFSLKDSISVSIDKYFSQAKEIERLRNVDIINEHNEIIILALEENIQKLSTLLEINKKPSLPNVFLVEAYSYVNMGKYSKVWLKGDNFKNPDTDKVFGLIRNGFAAGIAINKDNGLVGILNGDSKASYGVYIGESKSIGILKNNASGNVVIEYINAWSEIKEGDEVVTNGLDDIFFEGIKVGKIKKVSQEYGYIVAEIDLYNKNDDIGYFWLVDINDD